MNIKKFLIGTAAGALMLASSVFPALASSPFKSDLSNNNWRVFNINTAVPKLWDINKAQSLDAGGVGFTFNPLSTGWFTVYLKTNYNVDLTNKTIIANVDVIADPGTLFWTRSTTCANTGADAYVRLEFQSATGNYEASDYWWSTGANSKNLSTLATSGPDTLSFSTAVPSDWSNINGQTGSGDPVGFAAALKNVKEIGVAFGSSCRYASGVNVSGGTASFQLNSFTVNP
ncbi:hypothetical protein A3D78_06785 [Candidatus Gottesmanbacteria bacterium RIFCSPHIGHO2_02_FULL_39_14]|uniref:Uncharacterized protein n=1 Tax=Candidatus Gottesmanbacteria bacterium RIFCSPHIGHO2_02_FULL_39_14 TaxID=1798383 RepID=A0A1F6A2X6_9BACT|nr:MAG: hypothetical protein A3D78_06785 [Candidatus Gottesmanbacteria bacterium RIFCSPHIGHO2_02_FULL_39_14]